MALSASFTGASFTDVTGYRISACLTPGTGFQGNFYVYVSVRVDAKHVPGVVDLGKEGDPPSGPLQITGAMNAEKKIELNFPGITLITAEVGATRWRRLRLVEFQYPANLTDGKDKFGANAPKLTNTWTREVKTGRLGEAYKFNIGGGPENVLGFRSRQSSVGRNIIRLSSLGSKNSWMTKLLDFHAKGEAFNVQVGNLPFGVTVENAQRVYVEESFGDLLEYPPVPLELVDQPGGAGLGRFTLPDFSPAELLADEDQTTLYADPSRQEVVQTATIVFRNPHHRDQKLS